MMFKKAESKAPNEKERLQEDLDFINDFVKEGLHIQTTDIESVDRIGRYEENKSRPIKILFNNGSDQTRVLINLGNLKQAEKKFKEVFVSMDRNEKERKYI